MSADRFDPAVSIPLGEAPPGHYHPDPTIDAAGIVEGWHRTQPPASETPPPWTEAHRREAFARIGELGNEAMCAGLGDTAATLRRLMYPWHNEAAFRRALSDERLDGFDVARIDREVAIVRQRAEEPPSCSACSSRIPHAPGACHMAALLERDPAGLRDKLNSLSPIEALEIARRREADDLRAQLAAAKELLRASEPVVAAAEALVERWKVSVIHPSWPETLALTAAVKAARDNRVEDPKPRIVPCVAALVTDPAGRLLLVHTKRGWELPGGRMEPGEGWRSAIDRELREETGLDVVLDAGEPRVFDGMPVNGAQYQSIIVIARGRADGDAAPAIGDAVREARWFAAEEIPLGGLSKIATAEVVHEWIVGPCAAGAATMTPRADLLRDLRDIATGKIEHVFAGACPDVSHDPGFPCRGSETVRAEPGACPACDVLRRVDALLVPTVPAWTPPPGVAVEVLHGSAKGPLLVAMVTLKPGAEVPSEVHQDHEEMFRPMTGHIVVADGAFGTPVRSWFWVDPGVTHTVYNESKTETATYLAVLRRVSSADAEPATARRDEET